ncbi:E3 ubiquitin-protein ligase RNF115-like [Tenebrio molitor]|uniref:E3 ubiquitin-protein ligase RNF115-like n=1 Tax=Tenebrio molitor TaxID=7067 RepID=UPI0036248AE4
MASALFDSDHPFYCNCCNNYFRNDSSSTECPLCFSGCVEKILDTDQFPEALLDNTESPVEESRQTNQPRQDRRLEEFSTRLDILGSLVEQIFISPVDNARVDDRLHQQYHCHVCDIKFGNSSPKCPLCSGGFVQEISDINDDVNFDGLTSSAESFVDIFHPIRPTLSAALQPPPRSPPRPPIPPLRFTGPYAHTLSAFSSPHGFSLPPPLRNPVPNRENSRSTTFFWHMCEGIIQNSSRKESCRRCGNDFIQEVDDFPVVENRHPRPSVGTERPRASISRHTTISTSSYPRRYTAQQRRTIVPPPRIPSSSFSSSSDNSIVKMIKVNSEQRNANPRCSICWEDFTAEERVAELPCNHIYHEPCIVPWMQSNNNCPICRRVFPGTVRTPRTNPIIIHDGRRFPNH